MAYKSKYGTSSYGRGSYYGSYYNRDNYWDNDFYSYGSGFNYSSYLYGFSFKDEDEEGLECFIAPSKEYATPNSTTVNNRLDKFNYRVGTKENRTLIKEMSRFFYYKLVEEDDFIHDKYKDDSTLSDSEKEYKQGKIEFYKSLKERDITGSSPFEKAMFVFEGMMEQGNGSVAQDPAIQREQMENMQVDRGIVEDQDINTLLDEANSSAPLGHKFKTLKRLSLIKNFGGEFRVQKEVEERIVPNSNIIIQRKMKEYEQILGVELYQMIFPNYKLKLATKDLVVKTPIDKSEHKQKIIIICDASGSMSSGSKQEWVSTILLDRLKYVMKGQAELFFSFYIQNPNILSFTHIKDRKDAIEFWKKYRPNCSGGDTDVGANVKYISEQIHDKKKLCNLNIDLSEEKPEILILHDGY